MRKDRLNFVTIDTEDVNPRGTRRPQVIGKLALQLAVVRLPPKDIDHVWSYSDCLEPSVVTPHVLAFSNRRERVPDERNRHVDLDGVHGRPPGDSRWLSCASRVASKYA